MTIARSTTGALQLSGVGEFLPAGSDGFAAVERRLPKILGADYRIAGVARPGSAAELGRAVAAARREDLAILRLFSPSNVGARLSGSGRTLVIDLSRMNRVLAVDVPNATVRVEPGVTYAQLAAHFAREGQPLLVDSEPDPDASVAGSIFAKGLGRTPYGDHLLVQCGAEFVLADGSLLRTGMGAMEDNLTWQLYKYSLGPYQDGLAVQSDLMIPSQVGLWVMGQVPAFRHFAYYLDDDGALSRAVEAVRTLKIGGTLAGTVVISHRDYDTARGAPRRGAEWRLQGALYGVPRVVELSMNAAHAALGAAGSAVSPNSAAADRTIAQERALMSGRPGLKAVTLGGLATPPSLTFVAPIEGEHAVAMRATAAGVLEKAQVPVLAEFLVVGRSLLMNVYVPSAASGSAAPDALERLARQLIAAMGEAGFGTVAQSAEFDRVAEQALASDTRTAVLQRLTAAAG